MAHLGYARVSTTSQILDRQVDALTAAGVAADQIFTDKISGAKNERPGMAELLKYLREGDTVVVASLDRLGRSLSGILRTVETFKERGVTLRSIKESIDTSTDVGEMLLGIFGTLAEYERKLINERAADARAAAKARGKHTGRPRALSADQVAFARRMKDAGESVATICATLKISRATLYRVLGDAAPDTAEPVPTVTNPSPDVPACGICGGGIRSRKVHPVMGEGWYCSKCVQAAKKELYRDVQKERKTERIAGMPPERREKYEKGLAGQQRGQAAKLAALQALSSSIAAGAVTRHD